MAVTRLKRTRSAERRKVDLAVKYAEQGKATGGGRTTVKKLRHALEARYMPVYERLPKKKTKQRKGRHKSPPKK